MDRFVKNYEILAEEIASDEGVDIGANHFNKGDFLVIEHGVLQGMKRAEFEALNVVKAKKAYKTKKAKATEAPQTQEATA